MIPVRILKSPELQSLNGSAYRVLICLAGQYSGYNNGHLVFTEKNGDLFGIRKQTRTYALRDLEKAGLIVKTRKGGKRPLKTTRWALPWLPLDYRDGKKFDLARPTSTWTNENKSTGAKCAPLSRFSPGGCCL